VTRQTRLWFVAGLLATMLLVPVVAVAVTSPSTVSEGTTFNASDGPEVVLGEDDSLNTSQPFPTNDTVSLGAANISGDELRVRVTGLTDSQTVLNLSNQTVSNLSLARDDAALSVAGVGGDLDTLALDAGADLTAGRDLTVAAGPTAVDVEVRGLSGPDAVSFVDTDTGQIFDDAVVSGGTATVEVAANTTRDIEIAQGALPALSAVGPSGIVRAPGQTVSLSADVDHVEFSQGETVTVEFYRAGSGDPAQDTQLGSAQTFSSAGTASVSVTLPSANAPAFEWYAVATDSGGEQRLSEIKNIILNDDAVGDPVLDESTATDDVLTQQQTIDLSIAVSHENGTGENVTVEFYEFGSGDPAQDTELGNVSVTTDATATLANVTIGSGLDYYVVARGRAGQTVTSSVFSVDRPGVLAVRDEETGGLVDNRTVRFNITGAGFSETVDSQTGRLNYSATSAQAGETLLVDVCAQGYYQTTVQIPALSTNDSVFLQRGANYSATPSSVSNPCTSTADPADDNTTVLIRFELIDNTQGNFPPDETTLRINDGNGNQIHSELFGGLNRVDVILTQGERYQLDVDGPGGSRSLGGFTASESETVPVTIDGRDFGLPPDGAFAIDANLVTQQSINFITVQFADPTDNTSELAIEIVERSNRSNVIYQENVTGPLGNYSAQVAISDNQTAKTWIVEYEGVREGETFSGELPVGGDSLVPLPGGPVLTALVLIGLTLIAALYSGPLSALGSLILVLVSGGAVLFGWLPISPLVWFAAAVVAVGGWVRSANGFR
jgi:hypothetical protein